MCMAPSISIISIIHNALFTLFLCHSVSSSPTTQTSRPIFVQVAFDVTWRMICMRIYHFIIHQIMGAAQQVLRFRNFFRGAEYTQFVPHLWSASLLAIQSTREYKRRLSNKSTLDIHKRLLFFCRDWFDVYVCVCVWMCHSYTIILSCTSITVVWFSVHCSPFTVYVLPDEGKRCWLQQQLFPSNYKRQLQSLSICIQCGGITRITAMFFSSFPHHLCVPVFWCRFACKTSRV